MTVNTNDAQSSRRALTGRKRSWTIKDFETLQKVGTKATHRMGYA